MNCNQQFFASRSFSASCHQSRPVSLASLPGHGRNLWTDGNVIARRRDYNYEMVFHDDDNHQVRHDRRDGDVVVDQFVVMSASVAVVHWNSWVPVPVVAARIPSFCCVCWNKKTNN